MKFKDRLKSLRTERNLTQKELGEKIFVSRSSVAKWENGLGLPSRASYDSLLEFFEVSEADFPLCSDEEIREIKRNVRNHVIKEAIGWIFILLLAASPFILLYAISNGYGFTSKMAAGKWFEDNEVISTPDYDFYISYFRDTDESGETIELGISSFCVVEKRFYGFQRIAPEEYRKLIYNEEEAGDINDKRYGILYSFPGDNCYYNIFKSKITLLGPIESDENAASVKVDQNILSEIYVNGKRVDLKYGSFFVTEQEVSEFYAVEYSGEKHLLTVK